MIVPWKEMNPRDTFDSLASAPTKVAGPWLPPRLDSGGAERWPACRETPSHQTVVWEREGSVEIHCGVVGDATPKDIDFATRAAADAWLRGHGWILVDDEPVLKMASHG